jgi:hypothetical protein
MKYLSIPIFLFGAVAATISAHGISAEWDTTTGDRLPYWAAVIVSAALHYSWIVCTANARLSAAPIWLFSLTVTYAGLRDLGFATPLPTSLAIEGIPLALALSLAGPWEVHLERWRLARSSISEQVSLGPAVLPWAGEMLRGSIIHRRPGGVHDELHRLLADIERMEHRPAQPKPAGGEMRRKERP